MRLSVLVVRSLAVLGLLTLLIPVGPPSLAQVGEGATMTVLRGSVAVIRTDGSAIQPAPSGTTVSPGDEIRTLSASGAVITFFTGTEIELGDQTILVVERVSRQGERIDVSLRQVFGISVSHMQTFADSGSAYRVESGGAVALVRGSQLAVYGPQEGLSIFINVESTQPITVENCTLMPGVGVWFEVPVRDRGCNYFRAALESGPWNALLEGFTTAEQARQGDTRGRPAGQVQAGRVNETRSDIDKQKKDDDSLPTPTTTPGTPTPSATGTSTSSTAASPTPGAGTGTPVPCNNATNSGGEGVTTTVHALGRTSGTFQFIRDAFGIPDRFEVIYEGHVLLDTGNVSGAATHSITYGPGTSTSITVRVTGPTGTAWTYTVSCPT
jgi:hypothetical protein